MNGNDEKNFSVLGRMDEKYISEADIPVSSGRAARCRAPVRRLKRLRRFSAVAASLLLLCAVGVFIFGDPLGSGRNAGFQDGAGCMTVDGYSSVAVGSDGGSGETNGASEPDASEESAEEDGETSSSV